LITLLFRYRTILLVALHLVLVCTSYLLSYVLRFDGDITSTYLEVLVHTLPWVILFRLLAFAYYRTYRGWWRYVGMRDLVALLKAVAVSSLAFAGMMVLLGQAHDIPRSVYILDPVLTIALLGGVRFSMRALQENRRQSAPAVRGPRLRRVIIIGAGDAGEMLLREMHNNPRLGYLPVGFVDDDERKQGFHIHGVEVLGTTSRLARILETHIADELIIAIPSATRTAMQGLVNRCLQSGLPFKIVPSIAALSEGRSHVSQLRPVRVEDLLGREPVNLDTSRIRRDIAGRRVIITGAGGSIGSELARQVADYGPASLVLIERSESALFFVEQELRRRHADLEVRAMICDIQDVDDVTCCFRDVRPEIVYHAAAYKHVPLMEGHLAQAVRNNVFGTLNVAKLAREYGAKFVLISTDKAVSPSNVMGATKRLAERLVLSLNGSSRTHFVAVRFGNVLGSNGSVVPLFSQQIADGGPVTVTHPETSRYFMTIPEAVGLVLQASVLEEARDRVVMLEMGEPVKIVDLARNLIRLSGLEPDVDIPIVFTGLRNGEKLHEQLTADAEETIATEYEKIRIVRTESPAIGPNELDALASAIRGRDERTILRRMQELVPEFSPQTSLLGTLRDRAGVLETTKRSGTVG
jgi:FlaA1/EpsC-like NDP-sugar epimerase